MTAPDPSLPDGQQLHGERPILDGGDLPLRDVRVLDLSRYLAAPFAATLLGDLGAEVIKVEAVDRSDPGSHTSPVSDGVSLYYLGTTRNKRAMTLDLGTDDGQKLLRRLLEKSDVVVENYRRGVPAKLGVDFDTLRAINPRVTLVSVRSYSAESVMHARPAFDATVQAYTGIMSMTGEPDRLPVRAGVAAADLGTGLYAALGAVASVLKAREAGSGSHIEIALADTGLAFMAFPLTGYMYTGEPIVRTGTEHPAMAPLKVFRTKTDDLLVMASKDEEFARLAEHVGRPELVADERYATNESRVRNKERLHAELASALATRPAAEWERELEALGVACMRVRSVVDIAADPDFHRSMVTTSTHPVLGEVKLVRNPLTVDGGSLPFRRHGPQWGEHTDELLGELGVDENEIARLRLTGVIR